MAAAMEHTAAYRSTNRCWNSADTGSKLMNLYTSSSLPKPSSIHNAYKAQDEETIDVLRSYEPFKPNTSSYYPTNWADSSPWSTYADEIKSGPTAQLNTKIQSEKNEYGSEADLYGLVSNILEEQDKTLPSIPDGIYSPMLKSLWPLSLNRQFDSQGLLPDIKQSEDLAILQQDFRGVESVPSTGTHRAEDLFYELPGIEQDDHWSCSFQTDNTSSYNINPRIGFKECSFLKNCMPPASLLSETPKDTFQNSEPLVFSLNNYNFYTEPDGHDLLNRTKLNKNSDLGFQEGRSLANSSELTGFDTEGYSKLIQAKQNYCKPNNFIADQSYPSAKATNLLSDRSVPEYDHKSDYGRKTLGGGSGAFSNHLQKLTQRNDVQAMKPTRMLSATNSDWPLWMTGQPNSNSANSYQNQMKINSLLPSSQKGPLLKFNCSSTCSPGLDSNFPSHHSDKPAFPSNEYSYGTNQANRFGSTKGEYGHELASGKRLEPLNGLHENLLSRYNSHENTGKKLYQDRRMQYNGDNLYSEYLTQAYQGILSNMANYKNQRLGSGDNTPLTIDKATHLLNTCAANASMMHNMARNKASLSSTNFQSCFCHTSGASNLPLMDNYAYKELGQTSPRINDLYGDGLLPNMAHMLGSQKSAKLRSRSAAQLHLRLEECYQQCRALEQDRKKTECAFMETYPGQTMSSVNNICIQKLPANPSRVDRLIVDQLHEQARVLTLVSKMERYYSMPFHTNISTSLDCYLETIHTVQARRRDEMVNTPGRQKHKRAHPQDDRDVCALANSIKEMTVMTRKVRTALWCALQMALPFHHGKAHKS